MYIVMYVSICVYIYSYVCIDNLGLGERRAAPRAELYARRACVGVIIIMIIIIIIVMIIVMLIKRVQ